MLTDEKIVSVQESYEKQQVKCIDIAFMKYSCFCSTGSKASTGGAEKL